MTAKLANNSEPSTLTRAARGDGEALSEMAALYIAQADSGDEPAVMALTVAVHYARLSALALGGREAWVCLLVLLYRQAEALRAAGLDQMAIEAEGELIAHAEWMGEAGAEDLAQLIVTHAPELSPDALDYGRKLIAIAKDRT